MASVSTGQNCPSDISQQKDSSSQHEHAAHTSFLAKPSHDNRVVKRQRRGRPKKVNQETINRMVQILEESRHSLSLSWEQLGAAVGITGVHLQTVRNQLINEGYCKSVSCQRKWLTQETMDARVAFAIAHQNWPWRSVLFSSLVSFSLGPSPSRKAKVAINDRQQERLCKECHRNRTKQRGQERHAIHCWAIVGFDHKSPLTFFSSVGDNIPLCEMVTCRKHNNQAQQQPQMQSICSSEKQFLLVDEANESNFRHNNDHLLQIHGESKPLSRIVTPPCSPDLNIAHDVLLFLKKMVQKRALFRDEKDLEAGVLEEWGKVSVKEINKLVDSMPRRVDDVIRMKGKPV
ncbi:hypothetical protein T310_1028 [Rasamsonia emersonii CBS 393.64]|uniref:Tc1-like transposase DDE domain-containing protein n=1 Tax=Rasamsonia emersonii (strain ATCC 16479 / CBS 393.64 / IMI 116815) TaxID=1408163 RepID=A0A0F4Z342_RASE3|nr:hypothetical protein T310_1028 [Rasamsonia emersonii CBS 393.64]KKA24949.1 hypothetical protein T310_1028 [Rasamsonia emersonii CBS 393.64]